MNVPPNAVAMMLAMEQKMSQLYLFYLVDLTNDMTNHSNPQNDKIVAKLKNVRHAFEKYMVEFINKRPTARMFVFRIRETFEFASQYNVSYLIRYCLDVIHDNNPMEVLRRMEIVDKLMLDITKLISLSSAIEHLL